MGLVIFTIALIFIVGLSVGLSTSVDDNSSFISATSASPQQQQQGEQQEQPAGAAAEFVQPKAAQMIMSLGVGDVVAGVNAFGSNIFSQLVEAARSDGTAAVFLSPWGISHALSMLMEGATPGSASFQQLQDVVFGVQSGNTLSIDAVRAAVQSLSAAVVQGNDDVNLTVSDANSAWVAPNFPILDSYLTALSSYYSAEARPLIGGAADVNAWVEEQTHGKIKTIVDDPTAQAAALILVNAIYFLGRWVEPFQP